MTPAMVCHFMPFGDHSFHNLRVPLGVFAEHEEGRVDVMIFEPVQ